MGAHDTLAALVGAGMTVSVDGDCLLIRPSCGLTDAQRQAIRSEKVEILALLRTEIAGRVVRPAMPAAPIKTVPPVKATTLVGFITTASGGTSVLPPEERSPLEWTAVDVTRFTGRQSRLVRWGYGAEEADNIAERLTRRDQEADDRRLCLECADLRDNGRCSAAARGRIRGADRRLEPVVSVLQRCEAFGLRNGLE